MDRPHPIIAPADALPPAGRPPGGTGSRLTPTRVVGWVHPGIRRVAATIGPRQRQWEEHNAREAARPGPVWVSLGDSTVVGIGASRLEHTAAAIVHRRLREHTGEPWRLLNLGRYGAKADAVATEQLRRLRDWGEPALVTVAAGSNDIVWSWGLDGFRAAMTTILDGVPVGTVVGTVPPGWWGKGLRANDWLRAEAAARSLRVAEVGVLPQLRRMVAADGFHPNDRGYRYIAEGVLDALEIPHR